MLSTTDIARAVEQATRAPSVHNTPALAVADRTTDGAEHHRPAPADHPGRLAGNRCLPPAGDPVTPAARGVAAPLSPLPVRPTEESR
jgi:hypothetical protein